MNLRDIHKPIVGDKCLLCGNAPSVIGVFMPDDPGAWGAPTGKTRFVRYCLCNNCQVKPNISTKVEKIIRAELSGGGVTHE